jgi:hypothetical protein
MPRVLDNILQEINLTIAANLSYSAQVQFWKEAYLQDKDGITAPLVNNGQEQGYRVSWDDRYALQIYHRVIDSDVSSDPATGYGKYPYINRTWVMQLVCIGNTKRLTNRAYEGNTDVASEVFLAMPATKLSGGEWITLGDINTDKLNVMQTEFDGAPFKSLSLQLIAFTLEYEILQKYRCNEQVTNTPPFLCEDVLAITSNGSII